MSLDLSVCELSVYLIRHNDVNMATTKRSVITTSLIQQFACSSLTYFSPKHIYHLRKKGTELYLLLKCGYSSPLKKDLRHIIGPHLPF